MTTFKTQDEYRGHFISEFAKLERAIDLYISTFFITNDGHKQNQLISILIDRLSFGDKRAVLSVIFGIEHEITVAKKERGSSATYSKILEQSRLSAIIRNHFAHYHSVIPNHKPDAVLGLIQFRDNANIITYTDKSFFEEIVKITKTRNGLMKLLAKKG